jgi:hypothetical protein
MHRLIVTSLLTLLLFLVSSGGHAQSNVYSLSMYVGGTSYHDLCSFTLLVPPYHYELVLRTRYEDADGLVVMRIGHEKDPGVVRCRYLDVECGSESFTVWLDRRPPRRAREQQAESEERERQLKTWLETGRFQIKTFTLRHRTVSSSDQDALFALQERERFPDGGWTRATGPESNVIRITASTNDLVIWDRIIREFDKPHTN